MKDALREKDLAYVWHPYTDIARMEGGAFPIIERAEGVRLYDRSGREILDGISSWWGCNLGHGHPRLVEAIREQAGRLDHSILGGMSHPNAIRLAGRLAAMTPAGLERTLFASDGSSAVEAALKIALQYRVNRGERGRDRFVSLEDGYHGDTLGAMGVGFLPGFHGAFAGMLREAYRATSPDCAHCRAGRTRETCDLACFESMRRIVEEHEPDITAVIVEPLVQAAAGMRIYPEGYLVRLRELCDAHGVLLIADEIATGFGRTGEMFACERAGIAPDIMCLGKGLTGGTVPMSATMVTEGIFDTFRSSAGTDRTFYHGHTFSGNPIASAVALAALEVYGEEGFLAGLAPGMEALARGFGRIGEMEGIEDVRALGMIGACELSEEGGGAERARGVGQRALAMGLLVRPLGRVVYLWPPLVSTAGEVAEMTGILGRAVEMTNDNGKAG